MSPLVDTNAGKAFIKHVKGVNNKGVDQTARMLFTCTIIKVSMTRPLLKLHSL